MGNLNSVELGNIITKGELKSLLKNYYNGSLPSHITDKIIIKTLIFISGYIKCLQYQGIQPINSNEIKSLLVQESADWIEEYMRSGGK